MDSRQSYLIKSLFETNNYASFQEMVKELLVSLGVNERTISNILLKIAEEKQAAYVENIRKKYTKDQVNKIIDNYSKNIDECVKIMDLINSEDILDDSTLKILLLNDPEMKQQILNDLSSEYSDLQHEISKLSLDDQENDELNSIDARVKLAKKEETIRRLKDRKIVLRAKEEKSRAEIKPLHARIEKNQHKTDLVKKFFVVAGNIKHYNKDIEKYKEILKILEE